MRLLETMLIALASDPVIEQYIRQSVESLED